MSTVLLLPRPVIIRRPAYYSATKIRLQSSQSSKTRSQSTHSSKSRSLLPPIAYLDKPFYPNIDLTKRGSPQTLDQLRAPPQEYVEKALRNKDGTISFTREFDYYRRLGASYFRFYKEGLKRVWYNKRESNRLGFNARSLEMAALFPASSETRPLITRRDFQISTQAPSDFYKLIPFGLVLLVCGEFTPLVLPLLPKSILPRTCLREADQVRLLKGYYKRHCYMREQIGKHLGSLGREDEKSRLLLATHLRFLYYYVVQAHPLSFLSQYVPRFARTHLYPYLMGEYAPRHHNRILQDTVLIMRDGGFRRLSPEDICDYCLKTGNDRFLSLWVPRALQDERLPISDAMAKDMAPILDAYAQQLLDQDWPRIKPEWRWVVDYTARFQKWWPI